MGREKESRHDEHEALQGARLAPDTGSECYETRVQCGACRGAGLAEMAARASQLESLCATIECGLAREAASGSM